MSLRALHRFSALLIVGYALLHLSNHLAGLQGVEAHIAFMRSARSIYRFPPVEIAVLCAFAVQIVTGMTFVIRDWKQRHGFVPWLQAGSGTYLAIFLLIHVSAVMFGLSGSLSALALVFWVVTRHMRREVAA
jgi:succinate dehydrogenase/fumarate reductase cytochrome b subunit